MKKFICSLIGAATLFSLSAAPEKTTFDKLPASSQEFVQRYFSGETIRAVELDREASWDKYTVYFDSGNEVSFEGGTGDCSEVIMKHGSIPVSMLPAKVSAYVGMHYPNQKITAITHTKHGCRLTLANGIWADFNKEGEFVKASK